MLVRAGVVPLLAKQRRALRVVFLRPPWRLSMRSLDRCSWLWSLSEESKLQQKYRGDSSPELHANCSMLRVRWWCTLRVARRGITPPTHLNLQGISPFSKKLGRVGGVDGIGQEDQVAFEEFQSTPKKKFFAPEPPAGGPARDQATPPGSLVR